jgi:hypothetical protein
LLDIIKVDWLRPKTPKERNVMIKHARVARVLTVIGYFIMLVSVIFALSLPIFGVEI